MHRTYILHGVPWKHDVDNIPNDYEPFMEKKVEKDSDFFILIFRTRMAMCGGDWMYVQYPDGHIDLHEHCDYD